MDTNANNMSLTKLVSYAIFKMEKRGDIMSKKKVIGLIITLIIIVLIIMFARKVYLIDKIMKNVAKNNELTNYRINSTYQDTGTAFFTNGQVVVYAKNVKDDNTIYYMDTNANHIAYTVDTKNKTYRQDSGVPYTYDNPLITDIYEEMSFKDKIVAAFTWKVKTEKIDGEKCYYIRKDINEVEPGHEYEFWLDKENYCKIKATVKEDGINGEPEKTIFYHVEINTITDTDVSFERLFPDFSTFTKIEDSQAT